MVDLIFDIIFKKKLSKINHKELKRKIINQLEKIRENPYVGKPMKHKRKGTRELYIKPFRISYSVKTEAIYILDIYHKDDQ